MLAARTLDIPTPRAFLPLLQPKEFKGAFGGRGGGKSMFFANLLVEECLLRHIRAACVREVQDSIKDSVKQLIEDSIHQFGVDHKFKITDREITGPNDSLIIFRGLQNHTAASIKSLARFNRAWYEEAQSLSAKSLELATNTFRENGTEQWFSWNPDKEDDPVDKMFREATEKPIGEREPGEGDPAFVCVKVNYYDNPWFPDILRRNMERDRSRDIEKYGHIWLGDYRRNSDAQVFKNWTIKHFDPPPTGTPLYFGADWGMTIDPTVLVCCFLKEQTLYVWREVWALGCGIPERISLFDRIDPTWATDARKPGWQSIARKYTITADSAEPQTIDYMTRNGFPKMRAAVKGPNSVEEGVSFLQSCDIVVHPDCRNVAEELRLYSYKIDKKSGQVLPELEDKDNHTIDSLRYALEAVRRAPRPGIAGVYQGH